MKQKLGFFAHPIPLTAVALMAINDHWLKYSYPSWFTGKLSDFAGVFYFPIFLLALASLFLPLKDSNAASPLLTRRNFWLAVLFTDFLMLLIKLNAPAARWIELFFADHLFRIQLIQDPTDLLALGMNVLTFLYMKKYLRAAFA
jgi:hypothetical protein